MSSAISTKDLIKFMTLCLIDFCPVWIGSKILANVIMSKRGTCHCNLMTHWQEASLPSLCQQFKIHKQRSKSPNSPTQWRGPDKKVRLNDFLQRIAFIFGKNQPGANWNTFPAFYFIIKHLYQFSFLIYYYGNPHMLFLKRYDHAHQWCSIVSFLNTFKSINCDRTYVAWTWRHWNGHGSQTCDKFLKIHDTCVRCVLDMFRTRHAPW